MRTVITLTENVVCVKRKRGQGDESLTVKKSLIYIIITKRHLRHCTYLIT